MSHLKLLCVLAFVPLWAPFFSLPASAQAAAETYKVIYTGSLFGYFRDPELQVLGSNDCQSTATNPKGPEAQRLLDMLDGQKRSPDDLLRGIRTSPNDLLVATGNNFAPFLLARRIWDGTSLKPKEDLIDNAAGGGLPPNVIRYDNVVCFLRLAHFDAIVPGRHDFYFGPQRVMELAWLLYRPAAANYGRVRMLGVNLAVQVQRANVEEEGKDTATGAPLNRSVANIKPSIALPKVVLPWMRAIRVRNKPQTATVFLCIAPALRTTQAEPTPCAPGDRITLTNNPTAAPINQLRDYQGIGGYTWVWLQTDLIRNTSYDVFISNGGDQFLSTFVVAEPFLGPEPGTGGPELLPWELINRGGQRTAIFGVVDPDLDEFIGRLNYTWLGVRPGSLLPYQAQDARTHPAYETVVNVSDAAEALNQALQRCFYDVDCKTARKVLLAEMPQGEVQQNLLPLLRLPPDTRPFDIAISQADPDSATGNRLTEIAPVPGPRDVLERPTVLVPGTDFITNKPYNLAVRLQTSTITILRNIALGTVNSRTVENAVYVDNEGIISDPFNAFIPPLDVLRIPAAVSGGYLLRDRIAYALGGYSPLGTPTTTDQWRASLEMIGQRTMQNACHADIAMLQHRDVLNVFSDENLGPIFKGTKFTDAGIDAAIGAIYWKGDFIQCINMTGQTINSVLQHSADLQRAEEAGQFTDLSAGWALAYSGIEEAERRAAGKKPQWLVHGQFLDPKSLYSVATTDYLANGDTGYPDLQNAQPQPQIALADLRMWRFADHLHRELTGQIDHLFSMREALAKRDSAAQVPPKQPQNTFADWARSWSKLEAFSEDRGYEFNEQQKPAYALRLYKTDFGYALFQHNVSEGAIGAQFPGVTAVDLSAVDSESFTADIQLRAQYETREWELYSETDANFGRRNQRAKSSPFAYQPSQTADVWYLELGGAHRIYPLHQNPSGLKFIFPIGLKSQIVRPYTQITPTNGKPSATPVSAPRNSYWAFRPGFRFEHNFPRSSTNQSQSSGSGGSSQQSPSQATVSSSSKGQGGAAGGQGQGQSQSATLNSYIEGGFEVGEVIHSPSAFAFSNPVPGSPACPTPALVPVADLLQCIGLLSSSAQLTSVVAKRNFTQEGTYLNFRIDAPLPGRSTGEYIFENRGDLFFNRHSDAPVDVRFLYDMKHSLQLPVYGKFSVGPSVELIFFKTKVSGNYYFSYSTSVSLNYSFDWHPGLNWPKTLGFGSAQTPPNPLPTK